MSNALRGGKMYNVDGEEVMYRPLMMSNLDQMHPSRSNVT